MSRKYVILDISEVPTIDFVKVLQSSPDTLRYSLNGQSTFVKFEGDTPSFLAGKTVLSSSEMSEVLEGSDWTPAE